MGVGLDPLLILVLSGHKILAQLQAKFSAQAVIRRRRRLGVRHDGEGPVIHGVSVDLAHLSERLGLFVIIVLGESVVQVVNAAAAAQFSVGLLVTGIASFVLLAGIFDLSVVFGYAGLPHMRADRIPIRAALGLHCLVTGVVATVAVSLSLVVKHGSDPLPGQGRWLLCGAVAAYFALGVVTGVASHSSDLQRTISRVTTGIAVPLGLGKGHRRAGIGQRYTGRYVGGDGTLGQQREHRAQVRGQALPESLRADHLACPEVVPRPSRLDPHSRDHQLGDRGVLRADRD